MTVVIIALLLLILLTVLLSRARFFLYAGKTLRLKIRFLFFTFTVNKNGISGQQSKKRTRKRKTKINIKPLVILIKTAFNILFRRLCIERLRAVITLSSDEPSDTALHYSCLCTLAPLLTSALAANPKNGEIRVRIKPDFTAHNASLRLCAVLSVRPIDILLALLYAIRF